MTFLKNTSCHWISRKRKHTREQLQVCIDSPGDERYVCTFLSLTHAAKWVRQSKTPAGEILVKLLRDDSPFDCFYLSHRSWRFLRCPLQIHMYMSYINVLYISDIKLLHSFLFYNRISIPFFLMRDPVLKTHKTPFLPKISLNLSLIHL